MEIHTPDSITNAVYVHPIYPVLDSSQIKILSFLKNEDKPIRVEEFSQEEASAMFGLLVQGLVKIITRSGELSDDGQYIIITVSGQLALEHNLRPDPLCPIVTLADATIATTVTLGEDS